MIASHRCLMPMWAVLVGVASIAAVITRASSSIVFGIGASVGTAVAAGFVAFWLLVRPRLRALDRLRQAISELGQGRLSVRLGENGQKSLGDLAVRFDALGETLKFAHEGDLKSRLLSAIG